MKQQKTNEREPRILLVDDEPGTIRVLGEILKGIGTLYFTTRGTDALALARSIVPDLILLDVEIPDRHGFIVCEEIKSEPVLADIPILFVTSHTDIEMEARALEVGALDFIHKPPHHQIVRARVSNYLALKLQTDRLRKLSMVDGLTGLANRRAFDEAIDNEWRRACRSESPLSLLIIDIDYFKRYNDTHGHQAGDDCLREVACCLATKSRRASDMAARYGGEEFVLLLPECPLEEALKIAETVRAEVSELNIVQTDSKTTGHITVSIGVCSNRELRGHAKICWRNLKGYQENISCSLESADLIKFADQALYRAKQHGRNRVEAADLENTASVTETKST